MSNRLVRSPNFIAEDMRVFDCGDLQLEVITLISHNRSLGNRPIRKLQE